ncbi:MAG TPA: peptide chain release factor 3 [Acidobacteriota bacterium]|nr:peptide chain release factor 3 [Acidobacteriota bacterium]
MHEEILKRRTFAIISHPDAGKTTLTEKFLLYGGALQLAGSVTARKRQRETASDWMELEKQRGISVSSTLLQFDYRGKRMNLLDTPGHRDFSEDTYRVLMAVDSVIMVIDTAKGIESQTRKLFEICRERKIPIFAFMNKMDRPGKAPLELIDELETVLKIHAYPVNWPLGSGNDFRGVYDRIQKQAHLYERVAGGAFKAPVSVRGATDPELEHELRGQAYSHAIEELEILDCAHEDFNPSSVLDGTMIPVYFGSAVNNFGIDLLLDGFLRHSPPPLPRQSNQGAVAMESSLFSGFVFKMQANMNPLHRDRIAFMRVCSGRFSRDMYAYLSRTGKKIRLSDSHTHFGQSREIVDEAYPGDIVGLVTRQDIRVGDTLSEDPSLVFDEIPRFAPEHFGFINNPTPAGYKPFRKGIEQLLSENIIQAFRLNSPTQQHRILLGAVGMLQFDVLKYRLKSEYGADADIEIMPWKVLRWIESDLDDNQLTELLPYGAAVAGDESGRRALLFTSDWSLEHFEEKHRDRAILTHSPPVREALELKAAL